MSIRTRSIKAAAWSAVQSVGGKLVELIVFTLLARLLLPADWGLVAMASVFIAFFRLFIEQGLDLALVQREDLEPAHLNTAFMINVIMGLVLMLLVMLGAGLIASVYDQPELVPVIRWLSVTLLLGSLASVQVAILKRELRFKPLAVRMLLSSLVGGAVGIGAALAGAGVMSLVAMQITGGIVQLVVLWAGSSWRPRLEFSMTHFRDLYRFAINILGINLLDFANIYADTFLIGYFLGPTALGYYHFANRLVRMVTQLITSVTSPVSFSTFSAIQKDLPRLRRAYYEVVHMVSFVIFPIFVGLIVLAPFAIPLMFGEAWQSSTLIMQYLAVTGAVSALFVFNGNIMMASGKPSWRLYINLLNVTVNLIGILIAVKYGIEAVALAVVLRVVLLTPVPLLAVRKLLGGSLRNYFRHLLPAMLATFFMGLYLYFGLHEVFVMPFTVPVMVLAVLGGAIVYVLFVLLFDRQIATKVMRQLAHLRGRQS